ncbi:hypothetical protein LXM94_09125 [Rhizobium sp. TRM95111]|uniref:hypothetical protein n=1 Tax=Rhizobium alarense TaxID=2846851 RepID=UPI001F45F503|nr:hypothetical protein [Rhizobium alarense]MCF3640129.1 hypothetical protein [Rhizobium alarense]
MSKVTENPAENKNTVSLEEFNQLKAAFQSLEKDVQDRIIELQLGLRAIEIVVLSQKQE